MPGPPTPYSSPGVFNVLDPWYFDGTSYHAMVPNSTADAHMNTIVLNYIIQLAQSIGCQGAPAWGAIILFPGHTEVPPQDGSGDSGAIYYLEVPTKDSPAIIVECNWPIRFLGTGNVKLKPWGVADDYTKLGDMFYVSTHPYGDNIGGITFEDLTFEFDTVDETSGVPNWAAIHIFDSENCRIVRCNFRDCPIGVWFEQALECTMTQGRVEYMFNVGTAVWLGNTTQHQAAKEIFINDCVFVAGGKDTPNGSVGLLIQSCDELWFTDSHIDGFTDGIKIIPGPTGWNAVHLHFTACTIYTGIDASGNLGHCCLIQPQGSSGSPGGTAVAQVVFTSCFFELGETVTDADIIGSKGPGIKIDASYGPVDNIRFVSCYSARWPGSGLEVTGAATGANLQPANIEVLGGMYAGNNLNAGGAMDSYGIWLNIAQNVRISGVSCQGTYYWPVLGGNKSTPTQDTGIYVDSGAAGVVISGCYCYKNNDYGIYVNGASDVTIEGCDVRDNGTNGIVVDGSSTSVSDIYIRDCNATTYSAYNVAINISSVTSNQNTVQVTNCAGYNDQGVHLTTSILSSPFNIHNYALGYFGPLEFYVANGTGASPGIISSIAVDGVTTPLLTGSFYLVPGESATVTWAPPLAAIRIVLIGK